MRFIKLVCSMLSLGGVIGCVQSHRPAVVYYTPAVVAPASDRPEIKVYSAPAPPAVTEAPATTAPGGADPADVGVAASISQLLKLDEHLAAVSSNVETTVDRGAVTLRGTVPTEHDRDEIVDRVKRLPGVRSVDDDLGVDTR